MKIKNKPSVEIVLLILLFPLGLLISYKYEILLNKIQFREDIIASWWNCSKAGYKLKDCGVIPTPIPDELKEWLKDN